MNERLPHVCFLAPHAFPLLSGDPDIQTIGGAELQQVIIARGLARRGYPVSMICLDYGQADAVNVGGIVVHRSYGPTEGLPGLRFFWPRLTSMWSCLNRIGADIYYQRAGSMLTGVMVAHARRHGRKSIFAVAGNPMIRFARDRLIYEYGARHVDRIVVQNAAQEASIRKQFGRDSTLIPNCYEPPARDPGSRSGKRYVLWVSTIRQLKRPELFLDLAEALPAHRFAMVGGAGGGEQRLYDRIRERAARIGNLEFTGFLPYAEADRYFDDALLLVNTSDTEGFPNTFLQAWARQVPTVSFIDCGARAGGCSVGTQVASFEELVRTTSALLEDNNRRQELGAASEVYVRKHHFAEPILDRYEELFAQLLYDPAPLRTSAWDDAR